MQGGGEASGHEWPRDWELEITYWDTVSEIVVTILYGAWHFVAQCYDPQPFDWVIDGGAIGSNKNL